MVNRMTVYFSEAGAANTVDTLELAQDRAVGWGITTIIVACTTGKTALQAAEIFAEGTPCRIICVPYQKHLWEQYGGLDPEIVEKCIEKQVLFLPDAPKVRLLDDERPDICNSFRCFSEGLKVAVQAASMCVDTGLVEAGTKVISIGGTGKGSDTAIVVLPHDYEHILDSRIQEIIAIPEAQGTK